MYHHGNKSFIYLFYSDKVVFSQPGRQILDRDMDCKNVLIKIVQMLLFPLPHDYNCHSVDTHCMIPIVCSAIGMSEVICPKGFCLEVTVFCRILPVRKLFIQLAELLRRHLFEKINLLFCFLFLESLFLGVYQGSFLYQCFLLFFSVFDL